MMGWFSAIAVLISGLYSAHRTSTKQMDLADRWFELWTSVCATCAVTFLGTFGATGLSALAAGQSVARAIAIAVFTASLTTAAAFLALWKRSSLTRGIPILAPTKVEEQVLQGGFVYTQPNPDTGRKP